MFIRSSSPFGTVCWGGLLLALMGCSRSAVVVAPESASPTGEPAAARRAARGEADEADGAGFSFPDDAGGVLLAKVLPPKATDVSGADRPQTLRRFSPSVQWEPPALPLPPSHTALPRLPTVAELPPLRPRFVLDETLGGLPDSPLLPQLPSLPDDGRVRVPSVDVNQPIPLAILAQPVSDRASLDDPTAEASAAAAVAAPMPPRTAKAPFLKLTLPDPYDHRRTAAIPTLPESEQPAAAPTPQPMIRLPFHRRAHSHAAFGFSHNSGEREAPRIR